MEDDEKKGPAIVRMFAINGMMADIRYKAQIMARTNKLESGIIDSGLVGFAAGLGLSLIFVLVPLLFVGMI
jgi:tetrahydromethanopterin S-methyltransferase subunit F